LIRLHLRRGLSKLRQLICIAAATAAIAPTVALASFPGVDGVIAYSVGHSAQQGIWAVDPHTGGQMQLTSGTDEAPSFSPSGNLLAFQRRAAGTTTIFLARADGSNAKPLLSGSEPDFSPDGRHIVLVRARGLFVTALLPGSRVRQITNHPGDRTPRWSSTGAIAFQRTDVWHSRGRPNSKWGKKEELDVMSPDGRHVDQVFTSTLGTNMWPDWSPDGRTLAVDLCSISSFPLPNFPSFVFHVGCLPAVWAPDGRKLIQSGGSLESRGFSWGGFGTSCPRYIPEGTDATFFSTTVGGKEEEEFKSAPQISWQPLISGTLRVPTVPCAPRPEPGVKHSAVAPIGQGTRPTFCGHSQRHRRKSTCKG
jgi:dipeptidyl aminopeptidase/acylaminoacyl peptidase